MCGIVGYTGPRQALPLVLEGLRRLEYRGYDSAGVAILDGEGSLATAKKAGALVNLENYIDTGEVALNGFTGLGHTRWATHGGPTDRNAHPHTDLTGKVAVIHNGIIENFVPLRKALESAGIEMRSDTDTEVVAHLLGAAFAAGPTAGDLPASMAAVCRRLDGAFTLVAVHADVPDVIVAARRNSPLVIGVGDGEMFVASDVAAFIAHTREAIELGQDQLVVITPDGYEVTSFSGVPGAVADYKAFHVDWDLAAAEKGGYAYFMDKEIAEQPTAIADTLLGHFDGSSISAGRTADGRRGAPQLRQGVRGGLRLGVPLGADRQVRDRTLDPVAGRGGGGQRVPVPRPGTGPGHPGRRDQPVRRDGRHPGSGTARPPAEGAGTGGLQHQRLADPAGIRRGALHARRTGGRGRLDQGVPGPGDRELPGRSGARAGEGYQVPRRDRQGVRTAVGHAGGGRHNADA